MIKKKWFTFLLITILFSSAVFGNSPTLEQNYAYQLFISVINGGTSASSGSKNTAPVDQTGSQTGNQGGSNIANCPSGEALNHINFVLIYKLPDHNIDQCSDLGENPSYWYNYCLGEYPAMQGNIFACCSDESMMAGCYNLKSPTNFVFRYLDSSVVSGGTISFVYHADNADHYEVLSSGEWKSLGSRDCANTCSEPVRGSLGVNSVRVRACAGSELGVACTDPISASFILTETPESSLGIPTGFEFHFVEHQIAAGDEAYIYYDAVGANHFEIRFYNNPDHPELPEKETGWSEWYDTHIKTVNEESCRTGQGCSLGISLPGTHKVEMRACGGINVGDNCSVSEEDEYTAGSTGEGTCTSFEVSTDDYMPVYNYLQKQSFCSSSSSLGGTYEMNGYPCITNPQIYKYTRSLKGFRDMYNFNDPKIFCSADFGQFEDCAFSDKRNMGFTLSTLNNADRPNKVSDITDNYKLFIPPGTIRINIHPEVFDQTDQAIAYHYKSPIDHPDYTSMSEIPFRVGDGDVIFGQQTSTYGWLLDVAQQRDVYGRNGQMPIGLVSSGNRQPLNVAKSGWLYSRIYRFGYSGLKDLDFSLEVNVTVYREWYSKVRPCTDEIQDPSAGYCWDADGNPAPLTYTDCQTADTTNNYAPAEIDNDYVSLYSFEQKVGFCSQQTCAGDSSCKHGSEAYPCGSSSNYVGYPYRHFIQRQGFRDLFNLNDEKLLCGIDFEGGSPCQITNKRLGVSLTTMQEHVSRYISHIPDNFRVFIPPGTIEASVTTYLPNLVQEFLIVRHKMPPDGQYFSWEGSQYEDVPQDSETTASRDLSLMEERDVFFRNRQGHIFPFSIYRDPPMTLDESGWIYMKKLPFSSSRIFDVHISYKLDVPSYLEWYNTVKPCTDPNQDPTAGYCWDENGDPVPLEDETPDNTQVEIAQVDPNFVPLYNHLGTLTYCSDSTSGTYETGYPCSTAPFFNKHTINPHGFKEYYDESDPKILCGADYDDISMCELNEAYLPLTLVNQRISAANTGTPSLSGFPDGFRIFIPPGTTYSAVTLFFPSNAEEGIIERFQQPPEGIYLQNAWGGHNSYLSIPWDDENGITLEKLKEREYNVRKEGGHAYALPTGGSAPLDVTDSGWLYIQKFPFSHDTIDMLKVVLKVDLDSYLEWYNKVKPCTDPNQDPTAGYCWDTDGNPVPFILPG